MVKKYHIAAKQNPSFNIFRNRKLQSARWWCLLALRIGRKRITYFPLLTPQSGNLCLGDLRFPFVDFSVAGFIKTYAFTKSVSPWETAGRSLHNKVHTSSPVDDPPPLLEDAIRQSTRQWNLIFCFIFL